MTLPSQSPPAFTWKKQLKKLDFVAFKKNFSKDIFSSIISSWVKHTVILCYHAAI